MKAKKRMFVLFPFLLFACSGPGTMTGTTDAADGSTLTSDLTEVVEDTKGTIEVTDEEGEVVFTGTVHSNPNFPNDGSIKNAAAETVGTFTKHFVEGVWDGNYTYVITDTTLTPPNGPLAASGLFKPQ